MPYVHLLVYQEKPDYLVWNLRDCTFSDKKVEFPGGTLQTVSIRKLDAPAHPMMTSSWEVAVHCELDDPEMSAVEGAFVEPVPYTFMSHVRLLLQYLFAGNNITSIGVVDSHSLGLPEEDGGDLIYTVSVNDESCVDLVEFDLTRVKCAPANNYSPLCIRYDHPIELEFEVTE